MKRQGLALVLVASLVTSPISAFAQQPAAAPPAAAPAAGAPNAPPPTTKPTSWHNPKMDEARGRYTRGLKLYDEGNVIAARIEFERAYEIAPSYRILYNIALCYQRTNDYVEALRAFQQYLIDGGEELSEERRAEVQKEIAELKPNIATVTVSSNTKGATITIDDVVVGQTPLPDKIMVNPGRRKISATKAGAFPTTKSVVFAGADATTVSLDLTELPKAATPEKQVDIWPYVGWSATGALAVGAAVTGILALKANSDENKLHDQFGTTKATMDDAHSKTRTFSIAADCLTAGAVVAGGLSLYLTLRHKSEEKPNEATAAVRVTPTGAALVGRF